MGSGLRPSAGPGTTAQTLWDGQTQLAIDQTKIIIYIIQIPFVEGAFLETSLKRSGMRCLRARLVTGLSGGSKDQPGRQ
jgi:hypothetical protein